MTAEQVAEVLGVRRASVRKQVERGALLDPVRRSPQLEWDAAEFWDWYYSTQPKGYDQSLIPFNYWPAYPAIRHPAEFHGKQVTVLFEHPFGKVELAYPSSRGFGDHRSNGALDRYTAAVELLTPRGPEVALIDPSGGRVKTSTASLARVLDQQIPYWPYGLRFSGSSPTALASEPGTVNALNTIQGALTHIRDERLRSLLDQQVKALDRGRSRGIDAVLRRRTPPRRRLQTDSLWSA